jgi:hypothetical protein
MDGNSVCLCLGHCCCGGAFDWLAERCYAMQLRAAWHSSCASNFLFHAGGICALSASFLRRALAMTFGIFNSMRYARARQKPRVSLLIARTESVIAKRAAHVLHSLSRVKVIFLENSLSLRAL